MACVLVNIREHHTNNINHTIIRSCVCVYIFCYCFILSQSYLKKYTISPLDTRFDLFYDYNILTGIGKSTRPCRLF
jgi:hypothetical protein